MSNHLWSFEQASYYEYFNTLADCLQRVPYGSVCLIRRAGYLVFTDGYPDVDDNFSIPCIVLRKIY